MGVDKRSGLATVLTDELRERFYAEGWWSEGAAADLVDAWATTGPDRLAVRDDRRSYTWSELRDAALRSAWALREGGIAPGSRVAIQMPNRTEMVVLHLAAELAGLIYVGLTDNFRQHELRQLCNQARVDALITPGLFGGVDFGLLAAEVQPHVPTLRTLIAIDDTAAPGVTALDQIVARAPEGLRIADFDETRLGPDDVATFMATAGTTSALPKLALRNVNGWKALMGMVTQQLGLTPDDRIFSLAPIVGGVGNALGIWMSLMSGARTELTTLGAEPELVGRLAACEPTLFASVPTYTLRIMNAEWADPAVWRSLRYLVNGGAPLPRAAAQTVERDWGAKVIVMFGATDGLLPVFSSPDAPAEKRHTTVGGVAPGHDLRIVDEDGNDVAPGDQGEVWGRGPTMALGYAENPEETARMWDEDGWFHFGDLATLDEAGFLRVTGRKKDMILRGGMNISPAEIEELLYRHPAVSEVAVVRMPHPDLGEQACAFVVPKPGRSLTFSGMVDFLLEQNIDKHKLPERLELRAELPKTPAGKIRKVALEEEMAGVER